jgi:hypothetical protein
MVKLTLSPGYTAGVRWTKHYAGRRRKLFNVRRKQYLRRERWVKKFLDYQLKGLSEVERIKREDRYKFWGPRAYRY